MVSHEESSPQNHPRAKMADSVGAAPSLLLVIVAEEAFGWGEVRRYGDI